MSQHKQFFVSTALDLSDAVRITQPKELFDAVAMHKIVHWAKGCGVVDDDIRRFVGTIHVWERW